MNKSISLDGEWQLLGFPEGRHGVMDPADLDALGIEWISARVPGNVELDLQRAGRLPDPFFGLNIQQLRSLEGYEWWYRRDFALPEDADGREWELVCDGLDALAQVWINGHEVGRSENALIEQVFPVTAVLRPGANNQVVVRLGSVMRRARRYDYEAAALSWEGREEGLYIRKPPHCFGWDIMPRALSAGIWRSIRLVEREPAAIESLYFWTAGIYAGGARLGVRFQVRAQLEDLAGCSLVFEGHCGGHTFTCRHPIEFSAGGCVIDIPGARLWWPRGYGQPDLYDVQVRLTRGEQTLAARAERIGLRTVEVRRTRTSAPIGPGPAGTAGRLDVPPDPNGHFVLVVNGEPIMVKGTNWVPLDAFHSRDAARLPQAMALAEDINVNMIRCWGGNVYESDDFFRLCDEKGIMVWQDFALACCRYPQDDEFLARVEQEAAAVVRRLRNHPCLVLWCGDNEVDMVYFLDGLSPERNRLTREVLPRVVHRLDPYRDFMPSSPYISPEVLQGPDPFRSTPEQHLWGPRGYFKSRFYTAHNAHFIGEIGYHGCPAPESIRRFISPEKVWPWQDNAEWLAHSVNHWQYRDFRRDRIQLMANQVRELFGEIPTDLESFALASQITQAEAVKFFIESSRLRKWRTSGILWWNLLDGWPQFSDAVVDYYFVKKLAYYYIRRVQQPVCLIVGEEHDLHLPLVACNDSRQTVEVRYWVRAAGQSGVLLEGQFHLPANQNWVVERIRAFASDRRLLLLEWEVDGRRFGSHALLAAPPLRFDEYRAWLAEIAALPGGFEV